jgi:hypothetical protein
VDLALVGAAVLEKTLKLAAVRRLRALAFFVEALEDLVALASAVLLAAAKLCRQAEILRGHRLGMSLRLLKFSGGSVDDYAICRSS